MPAFRLGVGTEMRASGSHRGFWDAAMNIAAWTMLLIQPNK